MDGGAPPRVLEGHRNWVSALAVLEGARLASASRDQTVRVWDVDGGAPPRVLEGHRDWVTALAVLEGGRLASASRDRTVRVWEVDGGAPPRVLEGHRDWVTALAVLEGGRLASASHDYTVRVWDVTSGICLTTFLLNAPAVALAAFPSMQRLAVGLVNGEVLVLDLIQPTAAPPGNAADANGRDDAPSALAAFLSPAETIHLAAVKIMPSRRLLW